MNERMRTIGIATGLLALVLSAGVLMSRAEDVRPHASRASELAYLPKGEYLRIAVLGYRQLAADVMWFKVVQHIGELRPHAAEWRWAYHAADVVTDLDPGFLMAYLGTGTILGVWSDLIKESVAILQKGMDNLPTVWQLPFQIGYDYFYELCDPARAAPYIRIASTLPGAPAYLPGLAAKMTVEGGDPEVALEFLHRVDEQMGSDARMHAALEERRKQIIVERDLRLIEGVAQQYRAARGVFPRSTQELVDARLLTSVPRDPFGERYDIDPLTGSVSTPSMRARVQLYRKTPCPRQHANEVPAS